jgi:hypothetical protein
MSDFEDRLRAIAKEISRTVERNIDDIAESFGVDPGRAREVADAAGQWINEQVEGHGEGPFTPGPASHDAKPQDRPAAVHADEVTARPAHPGGPHPLDVPTNAQGVALSALDSGRWTVRPGSNLLGSTGVGPTPSDSAEIVGDLRARDWISAVGELTLVGRRALGRWYDASVGAVDAPADPADTPESPSTEG